MYCQLKGNGFLYVVCYIFIFLLCIIHCKVNNQLPNSIGIRNKCTNNVKLERNMN